MITIVFSNIYCAYHKQLSNQLRIFKSWSKFYDWYPYQAPASSVMMPNEGATSSPMHFPPPLQTSASSSQLLKFNKGWVTWLYLICGVVCFYNPHLSYPQFHNVVWLLVNCLLTCHCFFRSCPRLVVDRVFRSIPIRCYLEAPEAAGRRVVAIRPSRCSIWNGGAAQTETPTNTTPIGKRRKK